MCGVLYVQRYFAEYEFSTRYLLCCSDCESMSLKELLALADDDSLARSGGWKGGEVGVVVSGQRS